MTAFKTNKQFHMGIFSIEMKSHVHIKISTWIFIAFSIHNHLKLKKKTKTKTSVPWLGNVNYASGSNTAIERNQQLRWIFKELRWWKDSTPEATSCIILFIWHYWNDEVQGMEDRPEVARGQWGREEVPVTGGPHRGALGSRGCSAPAACFWPLQCNLRLS